MHTHVLIHLSCIIASAAGVVFLPPLPSPPLPPLSNASLLSHIVYLFPFFLACSCTTVADEGGSLRLAADVTSMLIRWNSRLGWVRAHMYRGCSTSERCSRPLPRLDAISYKTRRLALPPSLPSSPSPSPSPLLEKPPGPAADWLRR